MNRMLIDLQMCNFINSWRAWDRGCPPKHTDLFDIHNKLTDEEWKAALKKARAFYATHCKGLK